MKTWQKVVGAFIVGLFIADITYLFVAGYQETPVDCKCKKNKMSANDALRAGFTIVDPDGYEVEKFDELDYFTTVDKR